jgi:ribosomal protein S12 methylthiotransferase accessory factor
VTFRLGTSLRSVAPELTERRARRLMPDLGISRVTDITRLDRLGVPVYASVRPRGRTLRVHAGKGLAADEARVGALLEAVEYAVAEHESGLGADAVLSLGELVGLLPDGLRLIDFAPKVGMEVTPRRCVAAASCEDVATGARVLIPAELVFVPCPEGPEPALFDWSTNGLASGNSLDEATLHALLEVLERDAIALNSARDGSARIANDDLPAPFSAWAAEWRRFGVELVVRLVPNDFALPCFQAFLHEAASTDVNLAVGSSLHTDAGIALARAVCEAAQSRLTFIHGGRDDVTRFYAKYRPTGRQARQDGEARFVASLTDSSRNVEWREVPAALWDGAADPGAMLAELLAHLRSLGFGCVLRRRMEMGGSGIDLGEIHVVRVIVPRCEVVDRDEVRMGPRLMKRVLQRA